MPESNNNFPFKQKVDYFRPKATFFAQSIHGPKQSTGKSMLKRQYM